MVAINPANPAKQLSNLLLYYFLNSDLSKIKRYTVIINV
jgi:hypothetical protein